jgi:hypothetical protein
LGFMVGFQLLASNRGARMARVGVTGRGQGDKGEGDEGTRDQRSGQDTAWFLAKGYPPVIFCT